MATKAKDSKVIKLSAPLVAHLNGLREGKESYDSCLRRHFGLPSRTGHPQELREYYVIDSPKQLSIHRSQAEAKGEAILIAVRAGQKRTDKQRKEPVLTVRETP